MFILLYLLYIKIIAQISQFIFLSTVLMPHDNNCAVTEMWQNFIDECLIHMDENVQVCFLLSSFVDCKCIADVTELCFYFCTALE